MNKKFFTSKLSLLSFELSTTKFLLLMVLFVSIIPVISFAQTTQTFNTPGTFAFTVPAGVTSIKVEAWGSGGGGNALGKAGGGGAFAGSNNVTLTPGVNYSIQVGSGAGRGTGSDGQDSSFGNLIIAKGGKGGGNPGSGIGGLATESTGAIKFNGGIGGSGGGSGGGGGGGAGGTTSAGSNGGVGNGGFGGAGGLSGGGAGGNGGKNNEIGINGFFPGGGGGERGGSSTTSGGGGNGLVIVSWTCPPFSLTGASAVSTACTTAKSSIVTLNSSVSGLSVGNYTVSYTLSYNGNSVVYTAPMTVSSAGTGQFTASLDPMGANNSTTIQITNLASGSCNSAITSGNTSNTVNVYAPITPVAAAGFASCSTWNAQWNNDTFVSGYFLDVATTNTFTAGSYLAGFQDFNVGNVFVYPVTGLTSGVTYYYRVRNNNLGCGVSVNSNVISFVAGGAVAPTAAAQTFCSGATVSNLVATGTALKWYTASTGGTTLLSTTALATGTYFVSQTLNSCESNRTSVVVTVNTTVAPTSSAQTFCIGSTVSNLVATGTALQWYNTLTGGTALVTTTALSTGTYFVSQTLNSCESTRTSVAVTVNTTAAPTASAQTFCSGATVANLVATGTALQWYNTLTGGTALVTTTALATGTYFVSQTSNSCESTRTSVVVTVNTTVAPTVTLITQPNCVTATGSVSLGSLPATGTWTITANPATPSLTGLSGSGTTTTIGGLAANTSYTFVVSNASCSSSSSAPSSINAVITTTYNGVTWSSPPTLDKLGIINSNFPITVDVELCNCTVNATNAVVSAGITLKLRDRLDVIGNLTFESTASLVQINNVINSSKITYKRETVTGVLVTDYTYWSSPVSPLKLAGTGGIAYNPSTHAGSRFFSYLNSVGSGAWKSEVASEPMLAGKGYIIRGPNAIPSTPLTPLEATFVGVPNNGNITIAGGIIANRSYLLGNPYPSAMDADKFLSANNSVLGGTLYFWTHKTPIANGLYTSDDYATYTLTGGVGTVAKSDLVTDINNLARPTGKIGAGQGFFVSTIAAPTGTSIVFNNEMRTGSLGVPLINSQFFRTSKTNSKTTTEVEKNRIWLNLTNSGGAFKQLLVGYITGASNEYDSSYDGRSFSVNKYINFYSVLNSNLLTIQGRALPFDPSDLVPLGYVSTIIGEFSISIDEVDGALKSQEVFMEDKMLDIVHDLKVAPYKFVTAIGTFNDRFVLRYSNRTLNNENFDAKGNSIIVSKDKNELKVKSQLETIQRITIFNLLGKKVLDQDDINSNEFRSSNASVTNQTVIVKITLSTGIVISKKVAF